MFDNLFAQSGLSLDRLRTFREIIETGGIAAAAGDDPNRQSQFSRQLKELERYFGVELLERGHGPAKPTEAGGRLSEIAGHMLRALDEFRASCAARPDELLIGAGESVIQWLLVPRLPRLVRAHPALAVTFRNLKTDEIIRQVVGGALDFGVVTRFEPQRALSAAPLGKLPFCLFAPPSLVPAGARAGAQILRALPLAMPDGSAALRQAVEQEAQRLGIELQVRLRFSSYPQLAQAVRTLQVAAIMPRIAAHSFTGSEVRAIHLPFLDAFTRQVSLIWSRKAGDVRPAIGRYARVLTAGFRMHSTGSRNSGTTARI